jgi:hypothetical protein
VLVITPGIPKPKLTEVGAVLKHRYYMNGRRWSFDRFLGRV